jgi:hypothetical protein
MILNPAPCSVRQWSREVKALSFTPLSGFSVIYGHWIWPF